VAIRVEWYDDEKTILLETFDSEWTVDDYRRLIDDAAQRLSTVDHTVHIIADNTRSGSPLPANMLRGGLAYAVRRVPPNQGVTVFVGIDGVTEMLLEIARKLSPQLNHSLFSTDSLDNALTIIAQYAG